MWEQKDWLQTELDGLTSSPEDSPAKTCLLLETAPACPVSAAACGPSFSELSLKFDPVGQSLRMSLGLELSALTGCSLTWQEQATPLGRWWWVLSMPEPRTDGSGFGLLRTPLQSDAEKQGRGNLSHQVKTMLLPMPSTTGLGGGSNSRNAAKARGAWPGMLPTPTTGEGGGSSRSGDRSNETPSLEGMARKGLLPTPQAYSHGDSNPPGTTPLDRMVRWGDPNGRMLPTLKASDGRPKGNGGDRKSPGLDQMAKQGMLPTPTAIDAIGRGYQMANGKPYLALPGAVGAASSPQNGPGTGRLSPCFVEWMMGYPAGWTDVSD